MNVNDFIAVRGGQWAELEAIIASASGKRVHKLDIPQIERLSSLYRHASSDLMVASRDWPEDNVVSYLNNLCGQAHTLTLRRHTLTVSSIFQFYGSVIPKNFRAHWKYSAASLAILLFWAACGWLLITLRPDTAAEVVPHSLFDEMARGQVSPNITDSQFLAPYIFLNNIRVSLLMFILGPAIVVTPILLALNGFILGTLGAAVHQGHYDFAFWSLLAAHGIVELSIIVISGGAGLMLADSILRPGTLSRSESLAIRAKQALVLAAGIAPVLIISGILEGFVSPRALPGEWKVVIGVAYAFAFYLWLGLGGRRQKRRQSTTP